MAALQTKTLKGSADVGSPSKAELNLFVNQNQ